MNRLSSSVKPSLQPPACGHDLYLLAINLTQRCNLHCAHCYLDAHARRHADNELNTAEVHNVLDEVASCRTDTLVVLTGGEPLVRRDLEAIVAHGARRGLAMVVGTNGTLLTDRRAQALKAAGVMGCGISLDSLDPRYHDGFRGVTGAWAKALSGIENCRHHGLAFQIHFTVTGFLVPRNAGIALNGNLWMSTLFADRAPQGKVLLSCYLGGARSPEAVNWNDERSIGEAMRGLRQFLDVRGELEMVHIDRHEQALPLYHGPYPQRLRTIASRVKALRGLHLAANYWGGVSVSDRMIQGCATARRIKEALQSAFEPRAYFAGRPRWVGGLAR